MGFDDSSARASRRFKVAAFDDESSAKSERDDIPNVAPRQ